MDKLIVHGTRFRSITPGDNTDIQIGRPKQGDIVTGVMIENQGRNSLLKIWQDGKYIVLRPFETPFTIGVEYPACFDTTLKFIFEVENQQQYDAAGSRAAVDEAETDISQLDAVYHNAVLVETFVKRTC